MQGTVVEVRFVGQNQQVHLVQLVKFLPFKEALD
jgi:hypothetical protein